MVGKIEKLKSLIERHSNTELAKQSGHVYQVWDDGEITLQKSGDLLWLRSLHTISVGVPEVKVSADIFPENHNRFGYLFTDEMGAKAISNLILEGKNWYEYDKNNLTS